MTAERGSGPALENTVGCLLRRNHSVRHETVRRLPFPLSAGAWML